MILTTLLPMLLMTSSIGEQPIIQKDAACPQKTSIVQFDTKKKKKKKKGCDC